MWTVVLAGALVTTYFRFSCGNRLHIGALLPVGENPLFFNKDAQYMCEIAVDHVNESPNILPNHTVVMNLQDSRCNVGLAIYKLSSLLQGRGETMVALIGEGCSTVTQPIAKATSLWNVALFNFLSTSPALSNTKSYPNFYPLLPSENGLNPARVAMMTHNEWRKAIILIESSDIFDLNAKNLQETMVASHLETPMLLILPNDDNYTSVIQQVKDTGIRILFGLFYEKVGREILCEFCKNGLSAPDYVWHFAGWNRSPFWYLEAINNSGHSCGCSWKQLQMAVNGHFTYDFAQVRTDTSTTLATSKTVDEIAMTLSVKKSTNVQNLPDVFHQYSAYGYDCVVALALSLHKVAEQLATLGEINRLNNFTYSDDILIKMIRNVTEDETFMFEGLTGPVRVAALFSPEEKQRRAAGRIEIRYNTENESHFVALFADNDFVQPPSIPWTGKVPHDSTPNEKKYASAGIFITIVLLASIGLIVDLVLFVFTHQMRNHRVMNRTIPRINRWLIIGTAGVFIAVIFYGFDGQFFAFSSPSSLHLCFARIVALALGFTFAFGSILVKTIAELCTVTGFQCIVGINQQVFLRNLQYLLMGVFLLLDTVLLILWKSLGSFKETVQVLNPQSDDKVKYIRYKCAVGDGWSNGFVIYKLIFLLATIILVSIRIRVVSRRDERHSPYKDLIVSSYGLGFSFAAFGLIFIDDPGLEYALVSFVLILMSYLILGSMFAFKFFGILKSNHNISCNDNDNATTMMKAELDELRQTTKNQKKLLERIQREGGIEGELATAVSDALQPVAIGNFVMSSEPKSAPSDIRNVDMW